MLVSACNKVSVNRSTLSTRNHSTGYSPFSFGFSKHHVSEPNKKPMSIFLIIRRFANHKKCEHSDHKNYEIQNSITFLPLNNHYNEFIKTRRFHLSFALRRLRRLLFNPLHPPSSCAIPYRHPSRSRFGSSPLLPLL